MISIATRQRCVSHDTNDNPKVIPPHRWSEIEPKWNKFHHSSQVLRPHRTSLDVRTERCTRATRCSVVGSTASKGFEWSRSTKPWFVSAQRSPTARFRRNKFSLRLTRRHRSMHAPEIVYCYPEKNIETWNNQSAKLRRGIASRARQCSQNPWSLPIFLLMIAQDCRQHFIKG